ncbi:hypothetical protein JL720_16477 [Aureococcus anophagefferens]|nr:hypothetical protein JL720_16477 [Aureococcus anophagefferens]
MPLDTLSSYSFDASTFERFATADAPVIVGLEHGSANGVGVLAVVDASRASAAGAVVRAGDGVRREACDVDLYGEAEAHDAWLSRALLVVGATLSLALAALYDDAASKLHSRSTAARLAASVEAAESAAESTAHA